MPDLAMAFSRSSEMPNVSASRRITDWVMTFLSGLAVVLVLAPLVAIFGYLLYKGMVSMNWALLTQTPKPVGEAGGGGANGTGGAGGVFWRSPPPGGSGGSWAGGLLSPGGGRGGVFFPGRFTSAALHRARSLF